MAVDVVIPEVGEVGMEVTFVRWLKQAGDEVHEGDALFELDTAKSLMEVEAFAAGRLADIRTHDGDVVVPHQVVAQLLEPGEQLSPRPAATGLAGEPADAPDAAKSAVPSPVVPVPPGPARASPRAKRMARETGIDLATLRGTGPEGLITEHDVEAVAPNAAPARVMNDAPAPARMTRAPEQSERNRHGVAALTTSSWRTIPHFYLRLEADVTATMHLARPTTLLVAATARAMARHPECNLVWEGEQLTGRDRVDVGLLVDTPHGLLLPIVRDADHLALGPLSDELRAAAERARTGSLRTGDFGPRSITVSNLGMFAVDSFAGVIAAPDVLLLAAGRVKFAPHWDGKSFRAHHVMDLTLSVDHRALDGATAGRMLGTLEELLADPALLIESSGPVP